MFSFRDRKLSEIAALARKLDAQMAIYSLARRATNATTAQATADIATPTAAGVRPKILEVGIFLGAATASTFGLARSTALGTRTTPIALLPEDPDEPVLAGIRLVDFAIAWSVQPTIAADDMRRVGLPGTIGVGIIWTFPRAMTIDTQLSLVVVNRATNSAATDVHAVADC
jgi:hypothetical protein